MKRKWLCALLLCLLPALARADAPDDAMRLVVYTAHKEEVYQPIVEEFERRTGVWVQVVSGGTTELLERIARKRGMKVTISTAEEADFGCGDYDTILFNGTPSYITDLESVVRKAYDALPEGGRIILIDVPKESTYGVLYNLAKALGTWDHPLLAGTYPENPYPIEFVRVANWRTTAEKIELLEKAGFRDLRFAQTLTTHPLYSNRQEEQPSEGYEKGDYVAVTACK